MRQARGLSHCLSIHLQLDIQNSALYTCDNECYRYRNRNRNNVLLVVAPRNPSTLMQLMCVLPLEVVVPSKLTIRDIARLAGVSTATVSRVLNHKPDVDPETRQRIFRIMDQQGFVPSIASSVLALVRP